MAAGAGAGVGGPQRRPGGSAAPARGAGGLWLPLGAPGASGGRLGGGAVRGARLVAASRFLKFPILNRKKSRGSQTLGRILRAGACICPGRFMKGGSRGRRGQCEWRRAVVRRGEAWPKGRRPPPPRRTATRSTGRAAPRSPHPHLPPAPEEGPEGPVRAAGRPSSPGGPCRPCEGRRGCGAVGLGAACSRESIFKISHTKPRKIVRIPDPRTDVARTCLHLHRRVYEEGPSGHQGPQWALGAWGGCPGSPWAPLQAQLCC